MHISGGFVNYGQDIGILMLDTMFPRIRGDIGNATTFSFPVRYKVVKKALPTRVVIDDDDALFASFAAGAQELEREGVKAITTSCGFLAVHQQKLANLLNIPVFTSSLLQVPFVQSLFGHGGRVVIVTAHSKKLSERHFSGAGITVPPGAIVGLEEKPEFFSTFVLQKETLDLEKVILEMKETAEEIRDAYPDAGAIVMECTNLPPFRHIFQKITGLPVFDIVTLVNMIHMGFLPAVVG